MDVESYVRLGQKIEAPKPSCPLCSGAMQRWSGYWRHLRGEDDGLIWIPRVFCVPCGVSQALLPWFVLPWRWDEAEWIGSAVEMAARGMGYRRIAARLCRAESTVRAWLRRIRQKAGELSGELLAKATSWGFSSWEMPTAGLPRVWAAVVAMAEQWQRRRGWGRQWWVANLITGGRLLATNKSALLAGKGEMDWIAGKFISEVSDDP